MSSDPYGVYDTWSFLNEDPVTVDQPYLSDSSGNSMSGLDFGSIGKGMGGVGSLFKVFGDYQQGQQIAEANEYNAQLIMQQADFNIDRLDREETLLAGHQRALYAKAGVTLSGSPLDVMLDSASQVELDKQVMAFNAQSKANMLGYEGEVAKNQARMKMGMDLLSGAMSIAQMAGGI